MASNASIPALIVSKSESTHNLEDGVLFAHENIHVGETYLKLDQTLFKITPDCEETTAIRGGCDYRSEQARRLVGSWGGTAVRRFEVEAMKLVANLDCCGTPLYTDEDIRARIYHRYLHFGGLRHKYELPDMLPQSSHTVFTHADIAPRNIMVDGHYRITGILDWEYAGWYPDYWEYGQIMRPACQTGDWQKWMDLTAPRKWDILGIAAARRILF
ncbi:hypothetical protein GX48_05926 [Paracoccidioides brasiliensis]|nr:hypothetical protein GX48_05926 [Paracoccidioides brasiliensis]